LAFILRIYHDARSSECQTLLVLRTIWYRLRTIWYRLRTIWYRYIYIYIYV